MNQSDVFHMHTSQPYFVLKTDRFCQHIMASFGISHFYSCHIDRTMPESILFVPDGCSNIIFAYRHNSVEMQVLGATITTKPFRLDHDAEYFGVRFQPGENPCFSELPVKELVGNTMPLSDFQSMHHLAEQMAVQKTFNDRMRTFLSEYRTLQDYTLKTQHLLFRQIIRIVTEKNGVLRISELEKITGYSARYINYIFENEAGMSAKQFCTIVRLQTMLNRMNSGSIGNLSQLAEEFRFYDQSHFIHEFRQFTGIAPSEYLAAVKQKKFRQCVINL